MHWFASQVFDGLKKHFWWLNYRLVRDAFASWSGLQWLQPQFMGREEV